MINDLIIVFYLQIPWYEFDAKKYIDKKRVHAGEDAYAKNKFNQAASDNVKLTRDVPDTRNTQLV